MNIRARFITLFLVCLISFLFIWPSISQRTISVFILPDADSPRLVLENIQKYLNTQYNDDYLTSIREFSIEDLRLKLETEHQTKMDNLVLSRYDEEEIEDRNEKFEKRLEQELKEFKAELYLEIKGRFVQQSFLNEISRLPFVDPFRIEMERLWVEDNLKASTFKLGLDLQGGMNLVLEGDFEKLLKDLKKQYPQEKIEELQSAISSEAEQDKKEDLEFELDTINSLFELDEDKKRNYMLGAMEIIRSRVDKTGVSEPLIRIQGFDRIEVSLPGVASPEQAKKVIRSTAQVSYHLVIEDTILDKKLESYLEEYTEAKYDTERESILEKMIQREKVPSKYTLAVYWSRSSANTDSGLLQPISFLLLDSEPALSGDDISPNTFVTSVPDTGQIAISFQLTSGGRKKFGEVTTKNRNRRLAILIDGKVRSAPSINEPILTGQAQISGGFTYEEANDLALIIREGSLPISLKIVQESTIGPLLGKVSIDKGLQSILIGFILIILFILFYYHIAGIIAVFSLLLNLLILSAILALLNFTITLPGMAGIILTIGMAVDANVIIFERIRDELSYGKSLLVSVERGFERATLTILDSNLTTILAAVVLSQFGVGPIKGFAITLFVGILVSLFTSLFVSRTILFFLVYHLNLEKLSFGFGKYRRINTLKL